MYTLSRDVASSSQLVRPNSTLSTMKLNAWAADIFETVHMAFIPIIVRMSL